MDEQWVDLMVKHWVVMMENHLEIHWVHYLAQQMAGWWVHTKDVKKASHLVDTMEEMTVDL
jgi:hypothetical protein